MLTRISTVTISGADNSNMKQGQKLALTASVWPLRVSQSVEWKSSDKSVATVSANGVVTARSAGTVTIYAKRGSRKAAVRIQVAG